MAFFGFPGFHPPNRGVDLETSTPPNNDGSVDWLVFSAAGGVMTYVGEPHLAIVAMTIYLDLSGYLVLFISFPAT